MKPASYWIEKYRMQPHPEGGFYVETYRSPEIIPQPALPARFSGDRRFGTGIYFLLENHHFSALHRIQSDEMWHFYAGGPLNVYVIDREGRLETIRLGSNPDRGEVFQAVVPAGCWFGSKPADESAYSLVGCTVAPGFDFADFELGKREELLKSYPQCSEVIGLLT
ncbi:cupin domain-containing protein [Larkinella soli]|uniref:cupin domain-containing protein n=1 Tax=Larkinella soli TaxID=1770527 RepID=UPI000FFCB93E|nr:cupin domain-containing protein [Larkinella soli]